MTTQMDAIHKKLAEIMAQKDLPLRPTPYLKQTFTGFDGQEYPLKIRYYQAQAIFHLLFLKRFVLGEDTGLGKTIETIAALCYIWEKEQNRKVLVLTTKSATRQWAGEFSKFTRGIKVIICKGTPQQRQQARDIFALSKGPTVMIMGYRAAVQDFSHLQHLNDCILVADEATAFKNPKTQVHKVCQYLAEKANRAWGLTATLIKNNLMEGYGIYRVLVPDLFQMSLNQFMIYYCIIRMQKLPKSNRQIPVVVGYSPAKVAEFRETIKPYFIGRPKYEVASELPSLITQQIEVELTDDQELKYEEALAGLLEIGSGANTEVKETTKLSAITYCQEIINDLNLLGIDSDSSPKMDALVDLLTEGDLEDEKVIIFSRYRTMVDIIMPRLAKEGIKAVRITGAEDEDARSKAMSEFQNPNSDVRVVCITMAGSDSINLQAAKALVCYDTPWSAGDFIQLVGRMIRIGSIHSQCYAIHLIARGPTVGKTIDHRVLDVLGKKMALIESVLGKRFKGETDQTVIEVKNDISDLFDALQNDAKVRKAG